MASAATAPFSFVEVHVRLWQIRTIRLLLDAREGIPVPIANGLTPPMAGDRRVDVHQREPPVGDAAAEVVVGLGIIVAIMRRRQGSTADDISLMRG